MRKASPFVALLLSLHAGSAFAQPKAATPAAPTATSGAPATSAPPAVTPPPPPELTVPPPPAVDDPLLAPPPTPKTLLSSWRQAIAYLQARSTDLRIAIDQVLQAEAQTRIALAAYLPSINAQNAGGLSYTHNLITNSVRVQNTEGLPAVSHLPTPDTATGGLILTQAIVNVPAFDQISINELGEDQAKLSVEDEKRTLALSVANQIVSVVTAEREAEINRVGLRVALEQLEITDRKQRLGAANGLDVVRAAQNAANARATLVTGDESLRQARESLGLALGVPEEVGVAPNVDIDGLAKSAAGSCRPIADVDDRADIASAAVKLRIAKRNLRNVWYTFLPTVGLQSTLQATSVTAVGYPNPTWSLSLAFDWEIWDGGARYGSLRGARAAEDIAGQQLEALRRQAIIQVEQAQRGLVVAETSDRVAREQRDLAAQNDRMTQIAYTAGQGTSLELVTASEAHRQAELNLALADFNTVKARILAVFALASCIW